MSAVNEEYEPYSDDALISSIRNPAPSRPHIGHGALFTSATRDDLCNQFWSSHGCDLPRGHPGDDHLCLNPEDEAAHDYHQHGRVGIFSVCSAARESSM